MYFWKAINIVGWITCAVVFYSCANDAKKTKGRQLSKHQKMLVDDTSRIKDLINKAYYHISTAPDSAEFYYRRAYEESQRVRYHDGIVISVLGITNRWFEVGFYDSCEYYYDIAERNADTPDFDKRLYVALMINKGTYFDQRGDKVNADKAFYKGLQTARQPGRGGKTLTMYLLYNLASTKLELEQNTEALYFIHEADKVSGTMKDSSFRPFIRFMQAKIHLANGFVDSADRIIAMQLPLMDSLEYDHLKTIAKLYLSKGQPQKAIPFIEKGISDATHANNLFEKEALRLLLGKAFQQMGSLREARTVLQQVLRNSIDKGLHRNIPEAYQWLIETEKNTGNYQQAFILKENSSKYNDSILNEKKFAELNELNVRYKTEQKDLEISRNQLQLKQQESKLLRQRFYGLGATLAILFLIVVIISIRRDMRRKSQLREQELEMLCQENEIANLKSRMEGEEKERQRLSMELHDGIASQLSAAMMQFELLKDNTPILAYSPTYRKIDGLLRTTAKDIKNTANNLMPHTLVHLGLTDALTEYVQILSITGHPRIDLQVFGLTNDLPLQTRLFVYRIVQELLHNSIKHAAAKNVLVQVTDITGMISITVEDDGKGFAFETTRRGSGLNNIRSRLERLGGTFSVRSEAGKGTTVYIDFDNKTFFE